MTKIEIFTSPTCPYCPNAVKIVKEVAKERKDFTFKEISTFTEEGRRRAKNYDIRSVPTLIITNEHNKERIGYIGVPSKSSLNKMLNIATGKVQWGEKEEGKEGILSKLFKKLGG